MDLNFHFQKVKAKHDSLINMLRADTDLQIEMLQKEIVKKGREVKQLKIELDSQNELDGERERAFETKRLRHNQIVEKLYALLFKFLNFEFFEVSQRVISLQAGAGT